MRIDERPSQTKAPQGDAATRRRRNARFISLAIFLILLPLDAVYIYLLSQGESGLYLLGFWAAAYLTIVALITFRLVQTNPVHTGITLLNASIAIAAISTSYVIQDFGIIIGILSMIVIFQTSGLTLNQKNISRSFILGITSGVGSLLIDFSNNPARIDLPTLGNIITAIGAVAVIIQLIVILREFQNYSLRTKLIIAFLVVAIISIGTLDTIVNLSNRNILLQNAGNSLAAEANSRALIVGNFLSRELQGLQALGINNSVIVRVVGANNSYGDKTEEEIIKEIEGLDAEWIKDGGSNPLTRKVLRDRISENLKEYQKIFPYNVELFLTDKYGANISSTNLTSDYYQGDENWWRTARFGSIYIGQPAFDESSGIYAVIMAIPIHNPISGDVEGVLRTTLSINEIATVLTSSQLGNSVDINLYIAGRLRIQTTGGEPISGETVALDIPLTNPDFAEGDYDGIPSLVSRAQVTSLDATTAPLIKQLGWSLVAHQPRELVLAQSEQQNRSVTIFSVALLVIISLGGYYLSQYLARPIQMLGQVTEQISAGELGKRAEITTEDEIGALAKSFNQMADNLQKNLTYLEQSVIERTSELDAARIQSERRATELQSISEISKIISTEKNLKILLPLITELVSERFGFYHSGIFFLDGAGKFAVLEAASSEGGNVMLARGHRLEVGGSGIVGHVAKTGIPRIALDVGHDAVYFNNPDLPETRSEMSLPLKIRNKVSGILDIQSRVAGAFSDQELNTMSILADQISSAIENARLFEESQQALLEAEALYQQNIRENWAAFSADEPAIGYIQKLTGGNKLLTPVDSDDIREAINRGEPSVINAGLAGKEPTIVVPIKLRGQVIGVIKINAPDTDRNWTIDEVNLTEIISERLSLALENARLIQESQTNAAKEQVISEVTSRISSSINLRNILQTAVEELGNAIPGSEVLIKLQNENNNSNHKEGDNHAK